MTDSNQWKLSAYWHNEYNRFVHFADCLKKITTEGGRVRFEAARGGQVGCWIVEDHEVKATGVDFLLLDAFFAAKDQWDHR